MYNTKNLETHKNYWLGNYAVATQNTYNNKVEKFFKMVFNKPIKDVTVEDFKELPIDGVRVKYIEILLKNIKPNTVNNNLKCIASFFNYLSKTDALEGFDVDSFIHHQIKGTKVENEVVKSHTPMSEYDLELFKKFLEDSKYQHDEDGTLGKKYSLLASFMFQTGIRITAAFNILKKNIARYTSVDGREYIEISYIDKGNKQFDKYIMASFYDEIIETYNDESEEKLFYGVTAKIFETRLQHFSEEIGTAYTPHCLRAGSATTLYYLTNDVYQVKEHLGHSDVNQTLAYIRKAEKLNSGSMLLTEVKENKERMSIESIEENITKKDFIKLLREDESLRIAIASRFVRAGLL